jgi:hypothetical protein
MAHTFEYLSEANVRLSEPDRLLSLSEFELLKLTVEDFRFVTAEPTDDLDELAADIRSRATILRRLLCERDIFKVGRLMRPDAELRVSARMLDFEPPHPSVLLSCGAYPWKGDLLPGISLVFAIRGIEPAKRSTWSYRENADVSLTEYLDGLAIAVLGTRIRRREVVKYVADKKAAHVSEKRSHTCERAMDRAWSALSITLVSTENKEVTLNVAYLEILAVIEALAQSPSIGAYIDRIDAWTQTAMPEAREGSRSVGPKLPKIPIRPIGSQG